MSASKRSISRRSTSRSKHSYHDGSHPPDLKEPVLMRSLRALALVAAILFFSPSLHAQPSATEGQAIRAVLDRQVVDWNRGDIEAFATGYKNSPDILFMGATDLTGLHPDAETLSQELLHQRQDGYAQLHRASSAASRRTFRHGYRKLSSRTHLPPEEAMPTATFSLSLRKLPMDGRSYATRRPSRPKRILNSNPCRVKPCSVQNITHLQGVFMEYRQLGKSGLKVPDS